MPRISALPLFLEDDRLEPQFAKKIIEEIFENGKIKELSEREKLGPNVVKLIKEESAKAIRLHPLPLDQVLLLLRKKLLNVVWNFRAR